MIETLLNAAGLSSKVDDSGQSIGRRYARTDECGIPYAFTVDQDTLDNGDLTMRELNSMAQIRLPITDITQVLGDLTTGKTTWAVAAAKYPKVEAVDKE